MPIKTINVRDDIQLVVGKGIYWSRTQIAQAMLEKGVPLEPLSRGRIQAFCKEAAKEGFVPGTQPLDPGALATYQERVDWFLPELGELKL